MQNSGMAPDTAYQNKLIAALGCNGALDDALGVFAELRGVGGAAVSAATAVALIRACLACGELQRAHSIYSAFLMVCPCCVARAVHGEAASRGRLTLPHTDAVRAPA
jgi:hypothetical protein